MTKEEREKVQAQCQHDWCFTNSHDSMTMFNGEMAMDATNPWFMFVCSKCLKTRQEKAYDN